MDATGFSNRLTALCCAASNSTNATELRRLYDKSQHIPVLAERIAENPSADITLLKLLSDNPSVNVRSAVAANPASDQIGPKLATDPDALVRFHLACRIDLTEDVYQTLSQDSDPRVASRASYSLRKSSKVVPFNLLSKVLRQVSDRIAS